MGLISSLLLALEVQQNPSVLLVTRHQGVGKPGIPMQRL